MINWLTDKLFSTIYITQGKREDKDVGRLLMNEIGRIRLQHSSFYLHIRLPGHFHLLITTVNQTQH